MNLEWSEHSQDLMERICASDLLEQPVSYIQKLAKRLRANGECQEKEGIHSATPLKVAILSGFMVDFVAELVPLMFFRHNFCVDLYKGGYGEIASELLNPESALHKFSPDLLIVLPTHRDLLYVSQVGASQKEWLEGLDSEAAHWLSLWSTLSIPIVQLTFDPPPYRPLGELDGVTVGGRLSYVRRANQVLSERAPSHVGFVDAESLAMRVGEAQWHDAHLYYMSKQPFSFEVLPILAQSVVARSIGMLGRARKVLVVDLDNTLWGGVIGDDGLEGIVLGPETAEGEAFSEVQKYIKMLSTRGVVLAVCSKNDEKVARQVFREHDGMVLLEEDIAHFAVNFKDKATNISNIAVKLGIGLDAVVFVDDNPVERAWVSERLPEVLVVDMPDDPADYLRTLDGLDAFGVRRITDEDIGRSASYQARGALKEMHKQMSDSSGEEAMDLFLKDLNHEVTIAPLNDSMLDRVAQLLGKTNQFKLNPSIYSAEELRKRSRSVMAVRLRDRMQDYGIVSVVITSMENDRMILDNWVMSCRVFSRRLEFAIQQVLLEKVIHHGCNRIELEYIRSERNGFLEKLLQELGYVSESNKLGKEIYLTHVDRLIPRKEHHMLIIDKEFI